MNPIAFRIGPLAIYWYGLLAASAFILGFINIRQNIRAYGLDEEKIESLLLKLAVVFFVGARLGVVLLDLEYYLAHPRHIFLRAGLGSQGAIIAVMIVGYFWTKRDQLPYWTIADATAPTITIGHIFIRFGNLLNGELFGAPTSLPWAITFPLSGQPVHPLPLYEMLFSLFLLPKALHWSRQPAYPGYAFYRVLLIHSIFRFFLDFLRSDNNQIGPLAWTQIIALGFSLLMLFFMARAHKRQQ
ncbi:MAG: prolipoprotein diacylglyceryl transferase [Limnochordia bacterium]